MCGERVASRKFRQLSKVGLGPIDLYAYRTVHRIPVGFVLADGNLPGGGNGSASQEAQDGGEEVTTNQPTNIARVILAANPTICGAARPAATCDETCYPIRAKMSSDRTPRAMLPRAREALSGFYLRRVQRAWRPALLGDARNNLLRAHAWSRVV